MRCLLAVIFSALLLLVVACGSEPKPDEVAGKAAKLYYDYLVDGKYEMFVDGYYQPDSIPASYREQLVTNAKMFAGQQKDIRRHAEACGNSKGHCAKSEISVL